MYYNETIDLLDEVSLERVITPPHIDNNISIFMNENDILCEIYDMQQFTLEQDREIMSYIGINVINEGAKDIIKRIKNTIIAILKKIKDTILKFINFIKGKRSKDINKDIKDAIQAQKVINTLSSNKENPNFESITGDKKYTEIKILNKNYESFRTPLKNATTKFDIAFMSGTTMLNLGMYKEFDASDDLDISTAIEKRFKFKELAELSRIKDYSVEKLKEMFNLKSPEDLIKINVESGKKLTVNEYAKNYFNDNEQFFKEYKNTSSEDIKRLNDYIKQLNKFESEIKKIKEDEGDDIRYRKLSFALQRMINAISMICTQQLKGISFFEKAYDIHKKNCEDMIQDAKKLQELNKHGDENIKKIKKDNFILFNEDDFWKAIKEKDYLRLEVTVVGCMLADPTFERGETEKALQILEKEVPEIFKEYEKKEYEEYLEEDAWDKNYFTALTYYFEENFAKERIEYIKKVGRKVHKDTAERRRRSIQNKTANN